MITSTANRQIKQIIQLQKKSSLRRREDVFVAEGWKMCMEAPRPWIRQVFAAESALKDSRAALLAGMDVEVVADQVFAAMSGTDTPQGVLCVVRQPHVSLEEMVRPGGIYVLLENLQDPGNAGTILRTGEGAGVGGVILTKGSVDMYNPKTIRSTMGSIYRVPFVYVEDPAEAICCFRKHGIPVYAASMEESTAYDRVDYTRGCAFAVGNEGNGLTRQLIRSADGRIYIPMEGRVESLNAGVAASILMYEAYRQRR